MTNKEKALRLVWEHCNACKAKENRLDINQFLNDDNYYLIVGFSSYIQHAKLTASKISEYNVEEGRMLLEELEKL